jgi:hypothetical protein
MEIKDLTKIDFRKPIRDLTNDLYRAHLVSLKELAINEFITITHQLKPMTWKEFNAVAKGVN